MKILQISYNLISGGGERFVVDLCNQFAKDPMNEVILATTDNGKDPVLNFYANDLSNQVKRRFVGTTGKVGLKPKCLWGMYKIIKEEQPDIVHIHCRDAIAFLPAIFIRKPIYFHTIHNLAERNWPWPKLKAINRWMYKHRIHPITISTECQTSFVSYYHLPPALKITNGREPLNTTEHVLEVGNEIAKLKKNAKTPVFVHVARCQEAKNPKLLYDTFYRLSKDGLDFLLLTIGRGHIDFISDYEKNDQIFAIGEKRNIGDYMQYANYFVLSSNYEGLPLSLLEAMSMGLTPISTPAGGVKDVIRNGENGYITKSFNPEDFYNTLKRIIKNHEIIDPQLIKKEYSEKYSMNNCAKQYYDYYQKYTK